MRKILPILWILFSGPIFAQIPASLGWYQVPNTSLDSVFTPNNFANSGYPFFDHRTYLVDSWNSGAFDTKRNRYLNWGGGHTGYPGNEFYTFSPDTLAVARYNDPSLPIVSAAGSCGPNNGLGTTSETTGDGTVPNSRHTYDGIVYMPNVDRFFSYAGAVYSNAGCTSPATWTFSFSTNTWQHMNPANDICSNPTFTCPNGFEGATAAYDSNSQKVYVATVKDKWAYTYDSTNGGSYQHLGATQCCIDSYITSIVDPKRKKWIMLGGGEEWIVDIATGSAYNRAALGSTGGSAFISAIRPGLAYDPVQDRIVAWAGDNNIGILNMATLTWTTVTFAGGPAVGAAGTGTFKRFEYSPKNNLFMVRTGTSLNMFTLRLTPESNSLFNFPDRCFSNGVVYCEGFDSGVPHGAGSATGAYPDCNGTLYPDQETTIKASGVGSVRIQVPMTGCLNTGGFWRGIWAVPFKENSTYYFQWRQYMPTAYVNLPWNPKETISSSQGGLTCDEVSIVTTASGTTTANRFPTGYTRCGSNNSSYPAGFYEYVPNYAACLQFGFNTPGCPIRYDEQGDYRLSNCRYQDWSGCYHYSQNANTWVTYYWKVSLGTWGGFNSRIEAWVAAPGQVAKKYMDLPNFNMTNDAPTVKPGYDRIDLTTYMTDKQGNPPAATASYFDELIVSSQPIDLPSGQSIFSVPTAPANLTVGILP